MVDFSPKSAYTKSRTLIHHKYYCILYELFYAFIDLARARVFFMNLLRDNGFCVCWCILYELVYTIIDFARTVK